jgi:hypothetical protein
MAWPHAGRARHHYEQFEPLWSSGQEPPRRLLVLTDAPLSDEFKRQYPRWQQLGASVSGRIRLELWLATVEP